MKKWLIRLVLFLAAFVLAAAAYSVSYLSETVPVGTAYFAKTLCSGVFVSGRDADNVLAEDLALDHPLAQGLTIDVDREARTVTSSFRGFFAEVAVYREGLGCTLALGAAPAELRSQVRSDLEPPPVDTAAPWPDGALAALPGDSVPWGGSKGGKDSVSPRGDSVDANALAAVLYRAFAEPEPAHPRRTRAVAVVYDGRLVAERYAPGIGAATPLIGWSMTKSLTNALVGILAERGLLDVHAPADVPEWRGSDDPRAAITLDQLLRMSSGLEFNETYALPHADPQQMLFRSADAAAFAAAKPLAGEPDSAWSYSSGTSNIVARLVRHALETAGEDPLAFPRGALFDRLGMHRTVIEPDASGTFVGSSFSYAPARDWARLGLLYLQDGMWKGERLLPEGWVTYSTTPTPAAPNGRYGAHFWLNAGMDGTGRDRRYPELPADTYFMSGYEGQSVAVVPSRRAVIVRLGMTKPPAAWDRAGFVAEVLEALPGTS